MSLMGEREPVNSLGTSFSIRRNDVGCIVTTWLCHMIFYCSRHCPVGKCTYL
jgi:hypothetical protein